MIKDGEVAMYPGILDKGGQEQSHGVLYAVGENVFHSQHGKPRRMQSHTPSVLFPREHIH